MISSYSVKNHTIYLSRYINKNDYIHDNVEYKSENHERNHFEVTNIWFESENVLNVFITIAL